MTIKINELYWLCYELGTSIDRAVHYHRPDIILKEKNNTPMHLIHTAPQLLRIIMYRWQKIHKYAELKEETTEKNNWKTRKKYMLYQLPSPL